MNLDFAFKYPFSDDASSAFRDLGIDFDSVPDNALRAAENLSTSLAKNEKGLSFKAINDSARKDFLTTFVLSKVLVGASKSEILYNRFCYLFAFHSYKFFEKASENELFDISMGLVDVDKSEVPSYFVKISMKDYLKYPFKFNDLTLVNRDLKNGFVYLNRKDLELFLRNFAYWKLLKSLDRDYKKLPKKFKNISDRVKQASYASVESMTFTVGKLDPESLPPCMRRVYIDLTQGVLPSHSANVALATFLLNLGLSVPVVADLYKRTPKYNPNTVRYQLEFLAGKTTGKKYIAASCKKMQDWGICLDKDELCGAISHPLSYYKKKSGVKPKEVKPSE